MVLSQELNIWRAQRSYAPTDLRRKNLYTIHIHVARIYAPYIYTSQEFMHHICKIVFNKLIIQFIIIIMQHNKWQNQAQQ